MHTILVVDDDPSILTLLSGLLKERFSSCTILKTQSSSDALKILSQEPVHLLITDIQIDELDGIEIYRRAKAQNPMLHAIAISSYLDYGRISNIVALGFDDCISKPFSHSDLHASVQGSLDHIIRWRHRIAMVRHINEGDGAGKL